MTLISETNEERIKTLFSDQKDFFRTGKSQGIDFRISQLKLLKKAVLTHQSSIEEALWSDLHKSPEEAYLTEINIVLSEIENHLKHLKKWAKPKRVSTPLILFPSASARITVTVVVLEPSAGNEAGDEEILELLASATPGTKSINTVLLKPPTLAVT